MSEVAIILSDVPAAVANMASSPASGLLPAFARLGRFGQGASTQGWRPWLADWLGRPDLGPLAATSPAVVAAASAAGPAPQGSLWLAAPVHLTAGLRSVHMPPNGLLSLEGAAAEELVRHFNLEFAALGFTLRSVPGGFLVLGPRFETLPLTTDPAHLPGSNLSGATPQGPGAAPLLRLGAELEMWLYEHPLNLARAQARQLAISTLWLWGGGAAEPLAVKAAAADSVVLGADAFAAGLCTLSGAHYHDGVPDAQAILMAAGRQARVAAVVALFNAEPGSPAIPATMPELLQRLDAGLLAPLLAALRKGALRRLLLVANGKVTTLGARDGLKFWRRSRGPLAVLQ